MKAKVEHDRHTGADYLVVRPSKGEELDYAQAKTLSSLHETGLLAFYLEDRKRGDFRLVYDVTGHVALKTFLEAQLSLEQFRTLLDDVLSLLDSCTARGLDSERLLLEPEHVRIDEQGHIAAAYLPMNATAAGRGTARELLAYIAGHARFVVAGNAGEAARVQEYLRGQTVFSALDFRDFLESTAFRSKRPQDRRPGTERAQRKTARKTAVFDFVKEQTGAATMRELEESTPLSEQMAQGIAEGRKPKTAREPAAQPSADERGFAVVRVSDGTRWQLPAEGKLTVGRSKQCDIHLSGNANLSRTHAVLRTCDGTCAIVDQGSTNGTSVDGAAAEPHRPVMLSHGSVLDLGGEMLRVE